MSRGEIFVLTRTQFRAALRSMYRNGLMDIIGNETFETRYKKLEKKIKTTRATGHE